MPKEVYADEIERFLAAVEGVASARVFATPAGDIDRIYVTAENAADTREVRRAVAAALVSTYGVPVDPSRIRVALFREGLRPTEIPRFQIVRVEETVASGEVSAAVRIAWVRGGEEKAATGRARGPAGPAHRLQTLAAATVEAVCEALDPAHRRITVQQAAFATFLDRPVALVGLAIATPQGPEICMGAVPQDELPEAIVAAALDGVTRWLLRTALASAPLHGADRRQRLEEMRHFVRASERGGAVATGHIADAAAPDRPPEPGRPGPAERAPGGDGGSPPGPPDSRAEAQAGAGSVRARADGGVPGGLSEDPDVVVDLSEIRPTQTHAAPRGGAAMSVHQEPARGDVAPPRGRASMEDAFYQPLVEGRIPVHLRCRDGYELPRAIIKDAGPYSLIVETPAGTELVFKHGIISIRILPAQSPEA